MYWKYTTRKIDGKKRRVKVRGTQVRVVGHKNYTDKTARARGRTRRAGYYSATDKSKVSSHPLGPLFGRGY